MPWRGPQYCGELPALGYYVLDWMTEHLVVPNGATRGQPLELTNEQAQFVLSFYIVEPSFEGEAIRGRALHIARRIRFHQVRLRLPDGHAVGYAGGAIDPGRAGGFKICRISVPHTGSEVIQNGVMPYAVAAGGILPYYGGTTAFLPIIGQLRKRLDWAPTGKPGSLEMYDGAARQPVVPDGYGRGLVAVQASTLSAGTAGGATETLDSVLGTLQFAAVSGRRYRVVMTGLVGNGGAAGDTYAVRIRGSGSASAPTSASTLVAEQQWLATALGSGGRQPIPLEDSFLSASTGTHTLGFFSARIGGASNFTPVSPPTLPRRIHVYDVGNI